MKKGQKQIKDLEIEIKFVNNVGMLKENNINWKAGVSAFVLGFISYLKIFQH